MHNEENDQEYYWARRTMGALRGLKNFPLRNWTFQEIFIPSKSHNLTLSEMENISSRVSTIFAFLMLEGSFASTTQARKALPSKQIVCGALLLLEPKQARQQRKSESSANVDVVMICIQCLCGFLSFLHAIHSCIKTGMPLRLKKIEAWSTCYTGWSKTRLPTK